jgi:hypothetical protein
MSTAKAVRCIVFILIPVYVCSCGSSNSEENVGIKQAKYTVIEKQGAIEIRQYSPCIAAQTVVDSDFDNAGNIAFGRLFNYINGKNRKRLQIPMTAPVNQESSSEKIPMTAPVNQQKFEGKWVVSFIMPSEYMIETLPEPLDPNVVLREIPASKIAAFRYSGTWSKKRYEENKAKLEEFIKERGLKISGEAIFARYNSPFALFFLRRNEVLIPVE